VKRARAALQNVLQHVQASERQRVYRTQRVHCHARHLAGDPPRPEFFHARRTQPLQALVPKTEVDLYRDGDLGVEEITAPFGKQCLMARRLVERGVRFVQLFSGGLGNQNRDTWDAHADMKENHSLHAKETDLPIAGLLTDLKAHGLLDDTLVIWHSEFGRMPLSENGVGRDHNPGAMTVWMAGAGIKGGQSIGTTDEIGYKAEKQPISYHDLHATILALLGIDHKRLTYRYNGRDMRLTDVAGELIPQIVG